MVNVNELTKGTKLVCTLDNPDFSGLIKNDVVRIHTIHKENGYTYVELIDEFGGNWYLVSETVEQFDLYEEPLTKARGFEIVTEEKRKTNEEIKLPTRGTSKAMAYDFYSPIDLIIEPNKVGKIWTDVKAYMGDTECLILNVRSSMGGKVMMANTQGWIDSDYYSNENNDGNIGIFLKNISDEPYVIKKGDRIAQGAFFNFLISDNGNTDNERKGGFGSSGK